MHVTLPPDVEPVLIVLLLGVTTDYSVFFAVRHAQQACRRPHEAAGRPADDRRVLADHLRGRDPGRGRDGRARRGEDPAGESLRSRARGDRAHCDGCLDHAGARADRHLRHRSVLAGTALVPEGTEGRAAGRTGAGPGQGAGPAAARRRGRCAKRSPGSRLPSRSRWSSRPRACSRCWARPLGATGLRLGAPLVTALPSDSQPARAQAAAGKGFAAGIVSPTEVLILGRGVTRDTAGLDRLQAILARQPGVAGVIGPATMPALLRQATAVSPVALADAEPDAGEVRQRRQVRHHRRDRPARARRRRPDSGPGAHLPGLSRSAGLPGVRIEVGGETAAVGEAISSTHVQSRASSRC